jgi:alpha-galactosidase
MSSDPMTSRRDVLKAGVAVGFAGSAVGALAGTMSSKSSFLDLANLPKIRVFSEHGEIALELATDGYWVGKGVTVGFVGSKLTLQASVGVSRIQLRWTGDLRGVKKVLGDHWERSYADLSWQTELPNRTLPWYFMAFDGARTHGYGVMTGARALCFWNADSEGISLWCDVRNGGSPVLLGDRTLEVCTIISREGTGESPFAATKAFCHQMCPRPLLADHAVYGTNDWNYAYGNNSAELISSVSGMVSELSSDTNNRPYSVIDEGWAMGPFNGRFGYGPWVGNPRFGDMGEFAHRLKGMGVRPGIWFRPLTKLEGMPESILFSRDKSFLDPTIPESLEHVAKHFHRFAEWGYEMVKHDFSTYDITGRWGFEMGANPTRDGWHFNDRSKTTAEVILDLYAAIRKAAGSMRLIGCNTMGHLSAGTHEVQRSGDDTSGRSWDRTRRMGVNTLAFRSAQSGAFFTTDPDIVALTTAIPWELNEQWLRLVAHSGTALFVAADPAFVNDVHRKALKEALSAAAKPQAVAEPLDWLDRSIPREFKLAGKKTEFKWMGDNGAWPFGD